MGGPEREEPKFVLLCKLLTLLAIGKVEGAVEELRLGKAEDSKGRPIELDKGDNCLLYTSPSPRDLSTSRMPSSA